MNMSEMLATFANADAAPGPVWLEEKRRSARARAATAGFPTTYDEEWRFTRLKSLLEQPLHPARNAGGALTESEIAGFVLGKDWPRLVFLDGHYCPQLSLVPDPEKGMQLSNLRTALANGAPELEHHLTEVADDKALVFTALNTAFFGDGAFVCVAPDKSIEQPVHLLYLSTGTSAGATAHLRNFVSVGARSDIIVLEHYLSLGSEPYFTNAVTEWVLADAARADHCKIQEENRRAVHIAAVMAQQARASRFASHSVSIGAHLARHQIQTAFQGENGYCVLNGLYMGRGDQTVDHHTVVDHAKACCESHEYYHGILAGRAHGVFNGKIFVRQDAQKTNAKQNNRNLLLTDEAVIDTKPQLEIFADDVKCTHGATVGQIDEEAIFYLRARGIGLEQARQIMVRAFANDVVQRIPIEPVRAHLDKLLTERLKDKV
jgi:Fe-S cluster assembly protein SufD